MGTKNQFLFGRIYWFIAGLILVTYEFNESYSMRDYRIRSVIKKAQVDDGIIDPVKYKYKGIIVTYDTLTEEDIRKIKLQMVKKSLLSKEITSFIPLVSINVLVKDINFFYILAILQIALGMNDLNVMIIMISFILFSAVSNNVNYIFHTYLFTLFLYLIINHLTFNNIYQSYLENLGIVASIIMFINYFYFHGDSIIIPIIFGYISLIYIPIVVMRNENLNANNYLYNTYEVYHTL